MKHNVLKRTLAGVLAILCVAGYVPANVGGGGLFGGTAIIASAEELNAPNVTSSSVNASSYQVLESSTANLFDGNTGTKLCCIYNGELTIDFSYATPFVPSKYYLTTANDCYYRNPTNWTLQAKNSNGEWVTLHTGSDDYTLFPENAPNTEAGFTLNCQEAYSEYRLTNIKTHGTDTWHPGKNYNYSFQLSQIRLTYERYKKIEAKEPTSTTDGNTEYYVSYDGKYYILENGEYKEIEKDSWIIPKRYSITLNTNGGTINSGNIKYYSDGTGAILPTDVTKEGYAFEGWFTNANFTGLPVTEISAEDTGDKTYYAKWTFYVRMGSYNGYDVDWFCVKTNANGSMMMSKYVLKSSIFGATGTYSTSNIHSWLDIDSGGTFATDLGLTANELALAKTINSSSSYGDGTDKFTIPTLDGLDGLRAYYYTKAGLINNPSSIASIYWLRTRYSDSAARVIRSSDATATTRYSNCTYGGRYIRPMFYLDEATMRSMIVGGTGTEDDPYILEQRYDITADVPTGGGTISATASCDGSEIFRGNLPNKLVAGARTTLSINPATGYELESLTAKDADENTIALSDNTFTMPESNVSISASFKKIDYNLTYNDAENGSVTGVSTANYGDTVTLIISPDNGYQLDTLTVTDANGENVAVTDNSFAMPANGVTVSASFTGITYTKTEESAPTCTENGNSEYYTGSDDKYYKLENGEYVEIAENSWILSATGHDWDIDEDTMWVWDDSTNPPTAYVHLICKNDSTHTQDIQADVTLSGEDSTEPTCTEDGVNHYVAAVTIDGIEYTSEFSEELNAIGHDYVPSWVWADDYSSATLTLTCKNDNTHVETVNAVISSNETPATYDDDGNIEYTATAVFDGNTYTDTKNVLTPKLERTSIANATVSLKKTSLVYDGTEKTAEVTSVKVGGVKLTEGVDYEVTSNTATEVGTYTLTITGKGAYEGTVEKTWKVVKQYIITYTINGETKTKVYNDKTFCKVTAPEIDGKTFAYWAIPDKNGAKVSSNSSYTFRVVSNTSLEAVYVGNEEEVVAEPAIAITSVTTSGTKICYEVTRDIPNRYTVVSTGTLYGTSTALFADSSIRDGNLRFTDDVGSTTAKTKVYKGVSSVNTNQGYYSYSLNIGTNVDRAVYLRGYVIVKDSDNNLKTYYTDIVDKTYNQAKS